MVFSVHSWGYIGQALVSVPFYAAGFWFKNRIKDARFSTVRALGCLFVWVVTLMVFYEPPQNLSIMLVTQPFRTFYICAFAGSGAVIEFCKLFSNRWVAWYGENSIVPMLDQMVIIWLIAKIWVADSILSYAVIAVAACLFSGLCIPLFRNRCSEIDITG